MVCGVMTFLWCEALTPTQHVARRGGEGKGEEEGRGEGRERVKGGKKGGEG